MLDWSLIEHFHFLRPYWFLAFIAFLWMFFTMQRRDDSIATWRALMSPKILKAMTITGSSNRWWSPQRVSLVILSLVCIALMGPSWRQVESPFNEDQTALIIALDVSDSMTQSDIQPSRLLRAKTKILDLLAMRGASNTSLIAYAGSAHVVMPITDDHEMIRHFLDSLKPEIMPISGKRPEQVIGRIESLLGDKGLQTTVLLMGDGATAMTVDAFAKYFEQVRYKLIVWGMGLAEGESARAAIPQQKAILSSLASRSGGVYVNNTLNDDDVKRVHRVVERSFLVVDDGSRPWLDSGYGLLFMITPLFLFWFRRGWTLQW